MLLATCAPSLAATDETPGLTRDIAEYAACMKRLDHMCIVRMSHVDGYLALSGGELSFRQWRDEGAKGFESVKAAGGGMESVDIKPPSVRIKGSRRDYAILPAAYVYRVSSDGAKVHRTGFLLAFSEDKGQTWLFMEAFEFSPAQVKVVVPEYESQPLPPSSVRLEQPPAM